MRCCAGQTTRPDAPHRPLPRPAVSVTSLGSSLGTGGMSTKLIAAELATAAGVTTVIMRSTNVAAVTAIIAADEGPEDEDVVANEALPLCTRFLRAENRLAEWVARGGERRTEKLKSIPALQSQVVDRAWAARSGLGHVRRRASLAWPDARAPR